MFLSSATWAKLELKALEQALKRQKEAAPQGPELEFIPLAGKQQGFSIDKEAYNTILKQAEDRAAHLEREAYDKGFSQGEKDGFELGLKKAEKTVVNLERLFGELSALKQNLVRSHEKDILNIVFAIATKIVGDQGLRDEALVRRTVLKALHLAADRSELSLRIHPDDVQLIEKLKPEFFAQFKELKHLSLTPDPSLSRGGCLLESPCGDVDGRIETQLEEIHQVMNDAFKEHTP
jgi:flagellar assembly protein FliH